MSAQVTLAHAGHWILDLLFAVPMLIVGILVIRALILERRERRSRSEPSDSSD